MSRRPLRSPRRLSRGLESLLTHVPTFSPCPDPPPTQRPDESSSKTVTPAPHCWPPLRIHVPDKPAVCSGTLKVHRPGSC